MSTFHIYGSDTPISLEELQKLVAEDDEIIARAEFSGSEGCYVEVCRWNPATHQYERFCFRKVFGGELGDDANAEQTATAIASLIKPLTTDDQIFHRMPTWDEAAFTAYNAKKLPGRYINLQIDEHGNLRLTPTAEAIAEQADFLAKPHDQALCELLEDHLANGWRVVAPEEVGALTSGFLITREWQEDNQGNLTQIGTIWWDSNYQISCSIKMLFTLGIITFLKNN